MFDKNLYDPHLRIIEIYKSVQGETSFTGWPTSFVRLASCNLRCIWCDTPYSFVRGTEVSIPSVIKSVENHCCPYVCITGGEPLLQPPIHLLMQQLCDRNYILSLETGGSLSTEKVDPRVHVILDVKCPGSGMSEKNEWSNLHRLRKKDEVKFVIDGEEDYLYAKQICYTYSLFEKVDTILFSPVYGKLDPKDLINWVLSDRLPVRLNLQIHKYIWGPEKKGV